MQGFVDPPPRPRKVTPRIPHENTLDCECPPCVAYRAQRPKPGIEWFPQLAGLVLVVASVAVIALVLLAAGVIDWRPL